MKRWMARTAALLAVCAFASSARPANAAVLCAVQLPAQCGTPATFPGVVGLTAGEIAAIDPIVFTPRAAIQEAIDFLNALADAEFAGLDLSVFQSEFVRQCLLEELLQIRALTSATTGEVSAATLADFCALIADLRARLTQRRSGGLLNNCFFRLTCGINAQGFLVRCPEDVRRCLTGVLDALLRCAALSAGCSGVAPLAFPPET